MATPSTRPNRRREARQIAPPASDDTQMPATPQSAAGMVPIEPQRRHALICTAAYYLAEGRGFCPGGELDDWLAAESEIDRTLQAGGSGS
jgi:hypothetical protein